MQTPKNLVENVRKAVEGDLVGYGCVGGNRMGIADGEDYEFSWDEDGNAHYMQEIEPIRAAEPALRIRVRLRAIVVVEDVSVETF